MKEVEQKKETKIESVKQVSIEKKQVYLGKVNPRNGHTMFEVNYKLKTIIKAEFDEPEAVDYTKAMNGEINVKRKITKKPDCIYVSALNKVNVIKILK